MKKRCMFCGTEVHGNQLFCSKEHRYKYYHGESMVLTLKKQWFDMILSGIKKEEYREIKPYWEKRFQNYFKQFYDFSNEKPTVVWDRRERMIVFRNGYGKDKPEFSAECVISEGYGREEWGAEKETIYYILTIHRIFGEKNIVN